MTLVFLDTSAFVKHFVEEPFAGRLQSAMLPLTNDERAISPLAQVEVRSALQRRFRNREFTADIFRAAVANLAVVTETYIHVPFDQRVFDIAIEVIGRHALRSLDALQLASALTLRDELEAGDTLLFIACDHKLLASAAAEGLTTWDPADLSQPLVL